MKQMKMDQGFFHNGGYRGPLEVENGYAIRFVFEGEPTVYIYGQSLGSAPPTGSGQTVRVREVTDAEERERLRLDVARWKEVDARHVVWATF